MNSGRWGDAVETEEEERNFSRETSVDERGIKTVYEYLEKKRIIKKVLVQKIGGRRHRGVERRKNIKNVCFSITSPIYLEKYITKELRKFLFLLFICLFLL